mgnify:CR=1 FL=1
MRLKLYHNNDNPLFYYDDQGVPFQYIYNYKNLFALVEQDKWEFVSDIAQADVIPIHFSSTGPEMIEKVRKFKELIRPDQIAIFMYLYNADNHLTGEFFRSENFAAVRECADRVLLIHTNNYDDGIDPKYIFHDIMWNREKYYMCGDLPEDFDIHGQRWTNNMSREAYTYGPINKEFDQNNKKLLCLNRLYTFGEHFKLQRSIRTRLKEVLWNRPDIYISDPGSGVFFETNGWENRPAELNENFDPTNSSGTWYPVADKYYNTSYVSVIIESVVQPAISVDQPVYCITEKTFDPLLKGNFILPFSTPHYIKKLREWYGFKLPDWIDYSYDDIEDVDKRMDAFLQSVEKVYSLSIEELHHLYLKDKHLLDFNQSLFETRPYDSLHDKVLRSARQLGWK